MLAGAIGAFRFSSVSDMLMVPHLPFRLLLSQRGLFLSVELFFRSRGSHSEVLGIMTDPILVGSLGALAVVILIFLGMPIAFAMMFVGFSGICVLSSLEAAMPVTASTMWEVASFYPYTVIPLFIVMGSFAGSSGITRDLYSSFEKWSRQVPGGLAIATIGACGAFAAVSGSSVATAAAMGTVALPEMDRFKYDPRLSTGSVAAGGTLGFLIPPSIGFVVYGMLTEQSIGKLLISGVVPGILFRLSPGREVRLRGTYFLKCERVVKNEQGEVVELRCTHDPATRGGSSPDGRKVKATIHWVSAAHAVDAEVRLYDRLFTVPDLHDAEEGRDWKSYLTPIRSTSSRAARSSRAWSVRRRSRRSSSSAWATTAWIRTPRPAISCSTGRFRSATRGRGSHHDRREGPSTRSARSGQAEGGKAAACSWQRAAGSGLSRRP